MKITIMPSHQPSANMPADQAHCTICVEHPYDDLDVNDTMALVRQALQAWGFPENTVSGYFDANL